MNKIQNKLVLYLVLFLSGCASPQPSLFIPPPQPVSIEPTPTPEPTEVEPVETKAETFGPLFKLPLKLRQGIENDLRSGLKDPDSAKFGVMNAIKQPSGIISICGWVNAKNSYGGYTGETPFIAVYSSKTGHAAMGPIDRYEIMQPVCLKDGLTLEANKNSSFPNK